MENAIDASAMLAEIKKRVAVLANKSNPNQTTLTDDDFKDIYDQLQKLSTIQDENESLKNQIQKTTADLEAAKKSSIAPAVVAGVITGTTAAIGANAILTPPGPGTEIDKRQIDEITSKLSDMIRVTENIKTTMISKNSLNNQTLSNQINTIKSSLNSITGAKANQKNTFNKKIQDNIVEMARLVNDMTATLATLQPTPLKNIKKLALENTTASSQATETIKSLSETTIALSNKLKKTKVDVTATDKLRSFTKAFQTSFISTKDLGTNAMEAINKLISKMRVY